MKKLTPPALATFLILSSRLLAADSESSFGLAPSTAPQIEPSAPSSSNPLLPDSPSPTPKTKAPPSAPTDRTAMAEDKVRRAIALREATTKAERDPQLQALKAQAINAPTDFEQRKLFVAYYNGLIDRIAKLMPGTTKAEIDGLRAKYAGQFTQNRVAPTIDPAVARAQR